MKKFLSTAIASAIILMSLSCSDESQNLQPNSKTDQSARVGSTEHYCPPGCESACGTIVSGTWTGNGGHYYDAVALSFPECIPIGTTISFGVNANEFPNKFIIKDSNGVTVATSASLSNNSSVDGWMGSSNKSTGGYYMGPWSTWPGANSSGGIDKTGVGSLTISKQSTTYYLYVYTSLQPSIDNGNPLPAQQDTWDVNILCY